MARKAKPQKQRRILSAENIAKAFASEIDAPIAAVHGMSHIEISGNNEAVVQGCQGVLEYNENCIRLNLGRRAVEFRGTDLVMRSFTVDQAVVEGVFASISFS
ncbi:MAG: YabP/YqfC family sporulation protein [Oscillospiraceae bacterium]|jgi:sporulation protein YqfC|nr:YabP/YqfC family sporulation protein [Oscillospiraceae bacterium]